MRLHWYLIFMPIRLDIETIRFKNFLSYGDYESSFSVKKNGEGLGAVLILGENDDSSTDQRSSNGAGKSSLITAIIWCLFGRTISNPNPGDKIINWMTDGNAYVIISTSDGYEIIRTRNVDGHSELIIKKDGEIDGTLSTTNNTQLALNKLFGLDYEIFISSVFCGQLGKSFLEMAPTKRKEALERILGLTTLNQFADKTKSRLKDIDGELSVLKSKLEFINHDLTRQENRLDDLKVKSDTFEKTRQNQRIDLIEQVRDVREKLSVDLPDIDALEKEWDQWNNYSNEYNDHKNKLDTLEKVLVVKKQLLENLTNSATKPDLIDIDTLKLEWDDYNKKIEKRQLVLNQIERLQINKTIIRTEISSKNQIVHGWKSKKDTTCESCGQYVSQDHVDSKIDACETGLDKLLNARDTIDNNLSKLKGLLNRLICTIPNRTIHEAMSYNEQVNQTVLDIANKIEIESSGMSKTLDLIREYTNKIEKLSGILINTKPTNDINKIRMVLNEHRINSDKLKFLSKCVLDVDNKINPYTDVIEDVVSSIEQANNSSIELKTDVDRLDVHFKHYNYIYKAYCDRRKIKKWLLSELVPFLNNRIDHYLQMFEIDIKVSFDSTLSDETDKWGYEFCSGGERKRIDLSIMFALYDLYVSIYGRQCNVMVLDEVDGRLDQSGVKVFADIINDINSDLARSPDTILVISHKDELRNVFPNQIIVRKIDGFSSIDAEE